LLLNILIFAGIEFIVFSLLWILLLYSPGVDYFKNAITSSLLIIQKAGNLVIEYGYLIVSFIIVGFLDRILNKRVKVSQN
jgi:hypothetical protein